MCRKIELTKREKEIMTLMADGLTNKEAAKKLGLSIRTVQAYIRKIYIKFNARNMSNAVAIFVNNELNN